MMSGVVIKSPGFPVKNIQTGCSPYPDVSALIFQQTIDIWIWQALVFCIRNGFTTFINKKSTPCYLSALSCALSNSFSRNSCSALTMVRLHRVREENVKSPMIALGCHTATVQINRDKGIILSHQEIGNFPFCASLSFPEKPFCGFLFNEVKFNSSSLLLIPSFTAVSYTASGMLSKCFLMDLMLLYILFLWPIRVTPISFRSLSFKHVTCVKSL